MGYLDWFRREQKHNAKKKDREDREKKRNPQPRIADAPAWQYEPEAAPVEPFRQTEKKEKKKKKDRSRRRGWDDDDAPKKARSPTPQRAVPPPAEPVKVVEEEEPELTFLGGVKNNELNKEEVTIETGVS